MSLRARLLGTLLGLVVLGVGLAVGALFGALQDWAGDRTDDVLTAVGDRLAVAVAAEGPAALDGADGVWQAVAAEADAPSYVQLRGPGGVLATASAGDAPVLGEVPAGFSTVGDWLVRAVPVGADTLVVAMRTDTSDALLGRAAGVSVGSAVAALLGIALLAPPLIRRALRPLDDLVDTAAAIGGGSAGRVSGAVGDPVLGGTEVARLAHALDATSARIDAALRERDEAAGRLRRFVADASHELRTPVATIRGYAELFRRGAADRPADLAKVLTRVEAEAARMGRLVDDLLVLARLDEQRQLDTAPVDLGAVAAAAVAAARAVHPDRVWDLDRGGPDVGGDRGEPDRGPNAVRGDHLADGELDRGDLDRSPTVVRGDADRLRQIVDNLLANVARHTPPGTPASVRVFGDGDDAVLTVRDHGPGLPGADQARVFARFHRGASGGGGTGLGLAIVAAVAAAHGGTATAADAPGGGAEFTIRIPAEPAINGSSIHW